MRLTNKQVHNVSEAFNSLLRADYINIQDINQLLELGDYFVDFYGNVNRILQKQDNFIVGRRGSGKTALLLRGYIECIRTISPKLKSTSNILFNQKILPIYIDLTKCEEIFSNEVSEEIFERNFVRQIINSLKKQIEIMFNQKIFRFNSNYSALNELDTIGRILVEGNIISTGRRNNITCKEKSMEDVIMTGVASLTNPTLRSNLSEHNEVERTRAGEEIKGLNVQELLDKLNDISRKAKIDSIYIFIDEFSDLNKEQQERFSTLFKKFLASKINMFFKIGVITDRYSFGDKIRIDRDIFPIPLDFNEFVERYGGTIPALKKMEEFVEELIDKRLNTFCDDLKYKDVFKINSDELCYRLTRESLGLPRTIGYALQNSWVQCQNNNDSKDKRIGVQEVSFGIRSVRKMYFRQFYGSIKSKVIPGFYMDLWNDILQKAILEKNKKGLKPASHILITPTRKDYMNIFCENFIIHFLEESRGSKGGLKYNLYAIDFDICIENNIKYAEEKDEFTSERFNYDNILKKYDGYFVNDRSKSYRCNKCEKIYEEKEVGHMKTKRCFVCDEILEEILHIAVPIIESDYTEVETKILGLISELSKEEALSAREIADSVGCSWQKVALWGSKVLAPNRMINIFKQENRNYYYAIS